MTGGFLPEPRQATRWIEVVDGRAVPRALVIAEIGVNHQGDLGIARGLVHAAVAAGADAVKLQVRTPALHAREGVMRESPAAPPGERITELAHREAMELSDGALEALRDYAHVEGSHLFASAWDPPAVERVRRLLMPEVWKVASATLTDLETLAAIRAAADEDGAAIIASTGMSTWAQIDAAVEALGKDRLSLLHCCSCYPAEHGEINLRMMETLSRRYGVPVGYSGHERGIAVSVAAVAMGAEIVERHITLDRTMRGSDQAASLEPHGFATMVRDIRAVEEAMGDGVRRMSEREQEQARRLRR